MSKRYEEPADVEAPEGSIEAFWWRGRRYHVRQVLCHWREAGGWWEETGDTALPWARGDAKEIWRVDAHTDGAHTNAGAGVHSNGNGHRSSTHPAGSKIARAYPDPGGTYELCHDLRRGTWSMFRIWD